MDQNDNPLSAASQQTVNQKQDSTPTAKKTQPRKPRPNYNKLHSKPLPLAIHPLPAFHPSHPLSLFRLLHAYLSHLIWPPSSIPQNGPFEGYFSAETHSVHVTNPDHVRALWEMGFFGKGTLSRSEPSWLEREKARRRMEDAGAESVTKARRDERRLRKLERARVERERIERQRLIEEGKLDVSLEEGGEAGLGEAAGEGRVPDAAIVQDGVLEQTAGDLGSFSMSDSKAAGQDAAAAVKDSTTVEKEDMDDAADEQIDLPIENQEHLQLAPEEAFFLSFGLGVLSIRDPKSNNKVLQPQQLFQLFTNRGSIDTSNPPMSLNNNITSSQTHPDDPFLLNYAVYHHFRSLGWVVRPGIKFGVDYLLYNRGPVFSHAEFAIVILPAYTAPYWSTDEGRRLRGRASEGKDALGGDRGTGKDWWWLHCINRVQSQVFKTTVLCYVDVPPPMGNEEGGRHFAAAGGLKSFFGSYKVREFVLKRWVLNRSRD